MLSILTLTLILFIPTTLARPRPPLVQIRNSPVTIAVAARVNATGSVRLVDADRARAKALFQRVAGGLDDATFNDVLLTNTAVAYTATVGVGYPATDYTLLIDTGSSNTWIGANQPYVRTSTSSQTAETVNVTYGSGSFSGNEFIDQVTLSQDLVINRQSIGVATTSTGFQGVDGILGIGPVDLTFGTLSPNTHSVIPTITDNLFFQGTIPSNEVAISFEPTTSASVTNGELRFGGVDPTKFTGAITFTPVTTTSPASKFWGIDQSIMYGSSVNILSTTAGIVDTGTTLVLIASDAFTAYQTATGAILDKSSGLLRLTPAQFSNLHSLFFAIGGTTFELTANAQAWPRSLNSFIGGDPDSVYLIVGDLGTHSGQGLDFINGFTFLERFYSVFDTTNNQVGLATTPFTFATSN